MALRSCPKCGNKVSTTTAICPYCGYRFNQNGNGGILLALAFVIAVLLAPIIIVLGMFGKFLLKSVYKNILHLDEFKKFRKTYTIVCFSWFAVGIALAVVVFKLIPDLATYGLYPLFIGNIVLFALSIVFGKKIYKKHQDSIPADASGEDDSDHDLAETEDAATDADTDEATDDTPAAGANEYGNKKKMFELLAELAALRDANVLTEEEFNEQKQQILKAQYASAPRQVASNGGKSKAVASTVGKSVAPAEKAEAKKAKQQGTAKSLRVISLAVTVLTVVTFIVGVVFLLSGKIRYPHDDNTYRVLPVYIMAFNRDLVGSTRATNSLFTLIGTALMVIGLIVRLAVEAGRGKTVNRIIVADIIFMLVTTVAIVFSFITVDYGNAIFLVGAILIACCGVLTIIHMLLSIIKKLICGE